VSGQDDGEGYAGEVTVAADEGDARTAQAVLGARFDPLAGSVTWSGRISADLPLRVRVRITTPHGSATAATTERDPWGNTRVTGVDRPPFPVELLDGAADG
jgi:hypothetical protein